MGTVDSDAFKMYLQNIEEYVLDEDKVVTYKWLSKNFDIHVNTAKQLLYSFASEQKDKVYLTYVIGGFLKDDMGGSVQIVREEDIEKIKDKFKSVTSEHVYSVQKAKTIPDLNILYAVDVEASAEKDVKHLGSIKYNHSVLRPEEEVAGLKRRTQSAAADANEKKWTTAKKPNSSSICKGDEDKNQTEGAGNTKAVAVSAEENNANKKEQKKGGIAAMFATQSTKIKKQNEEVKSKAVETKKSKTGSSISSFFSRQVDKPLKQSGPKNDSGISSQSDSQDSPKKILDSDNGVKIVESEVTDQKKDEILDHKKEPTKKNISKSKDIKRQSNEKKGNRGKNKKVSVEEVVPAKKRKRIVVISDSEDSSDDDIFGKEEEDNVPCDSPPPPQPDCDEDEVIPPTPDAPSKKGRKRIRKHVDKTYVDSEGYMLTKKEYVFESCTESETEEEKEKENKSKDSSKEVKTENASPKKEPLSKKKKVSPQNTKQASIMTFFKKK